MKTPKLKSTTKFVVDACYLNHFLSCYHKHGIKHDHLGLPWNERWEFIMDELKKSLKRKRYGKTELHKSEGEKNNE